MAIADYTLVYGFEQARLRADDSRGNGKLRAADVAPAVLVWFAILIVACRLVPQAMLQHTDPILHIGKTQFQDANFPMDDQGRTYHLGTKVKLYGKTSSPVIADAYVFSVTSSCDSQEGEVASKILSVGSTKRAMLLSELLDPSQNGNRHLEIESDRGFLTITGDSCIHMQAVDDHKPSWFTNRNQSLQLQHVHN